MRSIIAAYYEVTFPNVLFVSFRRYNMRSKGVVVL